MFAFKNKCRRYRRLLSDRVDAPLSARAEKKVLAHLEKCPRCREELAFFEELREAAIQIDRTSPPAHIWERISVAIDEHPWGEDDWAPSAKPGFSSGTLMGKINLAGAVLSLILIAALSLSPGGIAHKSGVAYNSAVKGGAGSRDIEYVSLYLMANEDKFPTEVRDYYINHMEGLNQKIKTIKSALEHYPQNNHIKAQLALAYRQKIELYEEIGLSHAGGGRSSLRDGELSGDFPRGHHYD